MEEKQYPSVNMTEILGNKISDDNNSLTVGEKGHSVLADANYLQKMAHFDRERIPERVVHAKGSGAFGYFEVTNDLTKYTCARIFEKVGKRTEMFARFSTVGGEKGSADAVRDPRGFALKFYTEDGNYDIVGNDTPVFFIRDPIKFPDFIHTQKRNPQNNLKDSDAFWDFLSLTPESIHQTTILFTDRGTPINFRHMHGFGTNTFMWYNNKKEYVWVKYHFLTEQGIKNLTNDESVELAGTNPDSSVQDLFNSIQKGDFPAWKAYVQIMTPLQAKSYRFNPFDDTLVWFHGDFPLIPLGRFVLNRNPTNFFAEVEQAAFCPANFVPGISFSPDRMLQGRMFAYTDTQRHRLGVNAHLIPVNYPKNAEIKSYQRDGFMMTGENGGSDPNFFPNSYDCTYTNQKFDLPPVEDCGFLGRYPQTGTENCFYQAGELYRRVLNDMDKDHLIYNIVTSLKKANYLLQYRECALCYLADVNYGTRVANNLRLEIHTVEQLAAMTQENRVKATQEKNCIKNT